MDESNGTCNKRFAAAGIAQTEASRRAYRELLVTTPHLAVCVSGAILYDETIRQKTEEGVPFATVLTEAGIIPGIKVDFGAKDMAGHPAETITGGLDGLRERLAEYWAMGARFAKWRAVIALGDGLPSSGCVAANAEALAGYAALCQEAGLVPIIEPEVLMAGDHDLERCRHVTETVLHAVFAALYEQGVVLEGLILKPNMILPGLACPIQPTAEVVAETTVTSLLRVVPAAVAGIAFLSGGQSGELASERLNAMNVRPRLRHRGCPGPLSSPSHAPFNSQPSRSGTGRPSTPRTPSRRCITAPAAITPLCVAGTAPDWKPHDHGTARSSCLHGAAR
jgi:fructose-bisphosphate aldolase class I